METEVWHELSGIQHLIYLGVVATALTALYTLHRWLWPKVAYVYGNIKWIMTDQHDHAIIMERLDEISGKLERNGSRETPFGNGPYGGDNSH